MTWPARASSPASARPSPQRVSIGGSKALRDVPHAVMFIQAAETIRHHVDPSHTAYGESSGVYDRMAHARSIVLPAWLAYLNGDATLDDTVRTIADRVAAAEGGGSNDGAGD